MPAEAIIRARRIRTLDPEHSVVTSIAVGGGRILAVGDGDSDAAVEALRDSATVDLDFGDAVVTPGLTDSHTHVVFGVDVSRGIRLTDVGPLAEVQGMIEDAARRAGPGDWVLGWGLDPNLFTGIGFGGRVFDASTGDVPLYLRMRDGHSAIVNSAALRLAGVTGAERFDDEAVVAVGADGAPTGYLRELSAMEVVSRAIPAEPFADRVARLGAVLAEMAGTGICATHVLDLEGDALDLVEALEAQGELPVRLSFSPMVSASDDDELERVLGLQGRAGRRWVVDGVKFMIDGTVDNGSAWLERPDAYGQGVSSVWTHPAAYVDALRFFAERGVPTATHAIGDQGVRYVLDALESLGSDVRARAAHRIEHIETIPDDLVPRFAALGVAASMQPVHGTHHTRADRTDNWSVRLGAERAAHGWRCRDLRDAGAVLALGSDWPITPFDPRAMMADTILRRPVERPEVEPVQPEQALTALQALEGYTVHAAIACGLGAVAGTITAGRRADLTVWARDPLEAGPEALAATPIIATVVDGVVVHA